MNKNSKRVAIFVPEEIRDQLKKIAEENNRTMVGQLKEYVKSNNNEKN